MKVKKVAFFDIDGTVINIKSMFSFLEFYWRHKHPEVANKFLENFNKHIELIFKNNGKREDVNKFYYQQFSGCDLQELEGIGETWWEQLEKNMTSLFNMTILSRLEQHKENNFEIVAVSGSMAPCLKPILKSIGVSRALYTKLEINKNQKLTGRILNAPVIGEGKANVINMFMSNNTNLTLSGSFGYGDHDSDIPMLKLTQHPHVINPNKSLEAYAINNRWEIID